MISDLVIYRRKSCGHDKFNYYFKHLVMTPTEIYLEKKRGIRIGEIKSRKISDHDFAKALLNMILVWDRHDLTNNENPELLKRIIMDGGIGNYINNLTRASE